MPALRGIFVADPCEFTAALGNESVTFVFDRAKMTLRRDRELKRSALSDNVDAIVKDLLDIHISWDVVDDAGQPVPLSADIMLDLPAKALGNLVEGMSNAAQPSDAEGEASRAPSPGPSPTSSAMQSTHQNGPAPSTLPEPSAVPS